MTVPDSICTRSIVRLRSVSQRGYKTSMYAIKDSLNIVYSQGMNGLPGVGPNWELFAYTNHQTDLGEFGNDEDVARTEEQ